MEKDLKLPPLTAQKFEFLKKLYRKNNLPKENLDLIQAYIQRRNNKELADETTTKDLKAILELSKAFVKPFKDITQEDLSAFFDSLEGHLKYATIRLHKVKLRLFFRAIGRGDLEELFFYTKKG